MKTIAMPFAVFVLAASAAGCMGFVPTQLPDEKPFKDDRLAFIEIGTTTKDQVANTMSDFTVSTDEGEEVVALTPLKFKGGDWWLYARNRETLLWSFFLCTNVDCPSVPIGDGTVHHFLLIKFDGNGVVSEYEVSSLGSDGCNGNRICMHNGSFMLLESAQQDDLVKTFQPPNDGCSVFLYKQVRGKIGDYDPPISVFLDDDPARPLIDDEGFLHWGLGGGQHQIKTLRGARPLFLDIDCQQGDIVFVEYSMGRKEAVLIAAVEDSDGRREINKRRLIVMD